MKKIAEGSALLRKFALYEVSGTVIKEVTRSETETTGSVSTPDLAHRLAPNMSLPVKGKIKSKTTRYQVIHLKDGDGNRSVVELVDFLVPCAEGDEVSVWGVKEGAWFAARNLSTRRSYRKRFGATSALYPFAAHVGLAALLAVPLWNDMAASKPGDTGFAIFAALITFVIAGFLILIPMAIVAFVRGMLVMRRVPET